MIVVDTDVLIDLVARREPSVSFLRRLRDAGEVLGTTSINAAELLRGARARRGALEEATLILTALAEVPFGPLAARRFGSVMHALDRAGHRVPVVDGMIAAATLESGGRLVTRNVRDFRRVAGLEVLVPE